jgi:hypothetical protein
MLLLHRSMMLLHLSMLLMCRPMLQVSPEQFRTRRCHCFLPLPAQPLSQRANHRTRHSGQEQQPLGAPHTSTL